MNQKSSRMRNTTIKGIFFRVGAIGAGIVIAAVAVEMILRLLPVSDSQNRLPVNTDSPILRFEADRSVLWSHKWNFKLTNEARINNDGFISGFDYDSTSDTPLLAIVGDSYVEALGVPFAETGMGRMAAALRGNGTRAYSFGVAGAPLSQYLAWAGYARDRYRPQALVVVVVGNDFDQSLLKYKSTPGYHYFAEAAGGGLELRRVDFSVGWSKKLVRKSALVRYLLIHLELPRCRASCVQYSRRPTR